MGNPALPRNSRTEPLRRQDPTRGIIRLRCNCADSIYHSLQTRLEKRLSNNFSFGLHYTWSSFIDTASEIFKSATAG
jgi:hypothetical protein